MASNNEMTLAYWALRGRVGASRSLLAYCHIPYINKLYTDYNVWENKDKDELGFDYPNLPYIIDGDIKVTESTAVIQYIARKSGKKELIGDTDDKFIQVQIAFGVANDLLTELIKLGWTKGDFNAEREEDFNRGIIKNKLDVLNKNLEGKEWICGFLSIADFLLFEGCELSEAMQPSTLEKYPNLASFVKRFNEIPEIKAYKESKDFIPIWSSPKTATWSNAK